MTYEIEQIGPGHFVVLKDGVPVAKYADPKNVDDATDQQMNERLGMLLSILSGPSCPDDISTILDRKWPLLRSRLCRRGPAQIDNQSRSILNSWHNTGIGWCQLAHVDRAARAVDER